MLFRHAVINSKIKVAFIILFAKVWECIYSMHVGYDIYIDTMIRNLKRNFEENVQVNIFNLECDHMQ